MPASVIERLPLAKILQRIRQSVRDQTIVATQHTFAEMLRDDLLQDDVFEVRQEVHDLKRMTFKPVA